MCSISGGISWSNNTLNTIFLKQLIVAGSTRGRDSFGIAYPETNHADKFIGSSADIDFIVKHEFVILSNNRAEPTTEFVKNKRLSDVQPYTVGPVTVVHNGTIANDLELESKLNCKSQRKTTIDSEILGFVLSHWWDGKSPEQLVKLLSEDVVGSFALGVYDKRSPDTLWLAVNYKPLTLFINTKDLQLYFSSLEEYVGLGISRYVDSTFYDKKVEVPPYSLLQIKSIRDIQTYSLWKKTEKPQKKSVIIASSGLDSTVCASWSIKQGYDTSLLHFNYGCKATSRELEQIQAIATDLQIPLTIMSIPFFKHEIGASRLFESDETISTERSGISGAELALEWVPARNLIFMSIAAGFAEANEIDYIILGGNLEESGCLLDSECNKVKVTIDSTWEYRLPSEVKVGDKLLTLDEVGNPVETIVKQIFTPQFENFIRLTFITDFREQDIECSGEHPFYVDGDGWVSATYLEVGDPVIILNKELPNEVAIVSKKEIVYSNVKTTNFYCQPHNHFCVGELGILTHNSYPDNEYIFQKKFNDILPFALNLNHKVEILTPVAHLMKHEIVKLGKELGTPFHLTWSCYKNGTTPCGECGPDFMRRMGFKMNGWVDPQASDPDSTFWIYCDKLTRTSDKTTWSIQE